MIQINEKKIITLGFIGALGVEVLYLIGIFLNINSSLLSILSIAIFGIIAFAYLLTYSKTREILDLAMVATIGLHILVSIFWLSSYYASPFFNLILSMFSSLYFLALAAKSSRFNPLLPLLLGCAFVYHAFSHLLINFLFSIGINYTMVLSIWYLGFIICNGLCVIASSYE